MTARPPPSERDRALRYVSELVQQYRQRLGWKEANERALLFWHERIKGLTQEIGLMQAAGELGDTIARRWCKISGL